VIDASALGASIVHDADFHDDSGEPIGVTSASCVAVAVTDDGAGTFQCLVEFADHERYSYGITVTPDGVWAVDGS
jgi:hypothetical protein